jgi:hypothetical protein
MNFIFKVSNTRIRLPTLVDTSVEPISNWFSMSFEVKV